MRRILFNRVGISLMLTLCLLFSFSMTASANSYTNGTKYYSSTSPVLLAKWTSGMYEYQEFGYKVATWNSHWHKRYILSAVPAPYTFQIKAGTQIYDSASASGSASASFGVKGASAGGEIGTAYSTSRTSTVQTTLNLTSPASGIWSLGEHACTLTTKYKAYTVRKPLVGGTFTTYKSGYNVIIDRPHSSFGAFAAHPDYEYQFEAS